METIKAHPGKVLQMINEHGKFSGETESFVRELKNYTVVSIIGPQSSGKSYLLNNLFDAKFDVLNAAAGRGQTTKGIWIARCINPGMVIMDVEGFDGRERGEDDTLFERQSALFSLTVSDVLLLNMWFHDIGRHQGANISLIKLIFEERVKIEATKTTIVIVVRDHDYDETSPDITKKDLERSINELWLKVHPATTNRKMSDYIEVMVKDFPHKCQKQEFTEKSKDLSKFLCSYAASESLEQTQYGSGFSVSSAKIWDLIRSNKKIIAADHKLTKSKYMCKKIMRNLLGSLDQEKGRYKSLISDTSISARMFTAEISLVHKDILTRYEEETRSLISSVSIKRKAKLQKELQNSFEQAFSTKLKSLIRKTLSSAKSTVRDKIMNLTKVDASSVTDVVRPYLQEYDNHAPTAEDLPYKHLQMRLEEKRDELVKDLTTLAEEEANSVRNMRNLKLGCIIGAKIIIGTAWAATTCDPSLLLSTLF